MQLNTRKGSLIATYKSETWIINNAEKKNLEAFEKWYWRRMKSIRWMEMKTNEEILRIVKEKRTFIDAIRKRFSKIVGHILRHPKRAIQYNNRRYVRCKENCGNIEIPRKLELIINLRVEKKTILLSNLTKQFSIILIASIFSAWISNIMFNTRGLFIHVMF